jgi:flagellar protein FliL
MSAPAPQAEGSAPKKGSKKMLIIILLVLLLGGAAGGFFYFKQVKAAEAETEEGSKDKKGKKSKKANEEEKEETGHKKSKKEHGEEGGEEEKAKKEHGEEGSVEIELPDDTEVKEVFELQPFIINLADQDEARYLRLSVSVGLGESEGEHKPDMLFTTRIRNAMLTVLATKRSDEIRTSEGKAKLRKQLLEAAQAASEEPHVHAIYITDFIIQL